MSLIPDPLNAFPRFLNALDSLLVGQNLSEQDGIPEQLQLHPSLTGKQIVQRVERFVRQLFDANKVTPISAFSFAVFLDRWNRYISTSEKFGPKDVKKAGKGIIQKLFLEYLQYTPLKAVEVLQERTPASMSGVELRVLERSLCSIIVAHRNFKYTLYSFGFTHLGAIFGSQVVREGVNLRLSPKNEFIHIDWATVPLSTPDGITIAAQLQKAEKSGTTRKVLKELYGEIAFLNDEGKRVLTATTADYLWGCVAGFDNLFWDRVSFSSISACLNEGNLLHPLIRQSLLVLDRYWDECLIREKQSPDVYNAEQMLQLKKKLFEDLVRIASCYNRCFSTLALLYEEGFRLYKSAMKAMKVFVDETTVQLPDPSVFVQDRPCLPVASLPAIPLDLRGMSDIVLKHYGEREETFVSFLFDSPEAQQTVIDDMDGVAPEEPIEEDPQPEECSTDAAACSFLPPKLFHYVKPLPKPKKRVREAFQRLSLSESVAPQPTPPVLIPPPPPAAVILKIAAACAKKERPPVKPWSPWVAVNRLEGPESMILKELGLAPVKKHWHVEKLFVLRQEGSQPLSQEIRFHLMPTLIARLMQMISRPYFRYSDHRQIEDLAYSCVGLWHEYSKGKEPILGVYTAGFFAHDNVDGDEGELYHLFFKRTESSDCIREFQKNTAFAAAADFEEVTAEERKCHSVSTGPVVRYRVLFAPYACTVEDSFEGVRYTLAPAKRIHLPQ